MKKQLRQWGAATLVIVMTVMAPIQSAASSINNPLVQNGDAKIGMVATPSDAELEDDVELEPEIGTPSNADLMKAAPLELKSFVVKFYVDSELWDTQEIEKGGCAAEPDNPVKEGYTFLGWDTNYAYIDQNLSIKAKFTKGIFETHRVLFVDYDGRWLQSPSYVIDENDAVRPAAPKREGYTFVGWDKQPYVIQKDTVITAKYREGNFKTYLLSYQSRHPQKDKEFNTIGVEWVIEGENGTPPTPVPVPGYTFNRWSTDYINVTKDSLVYARYYTGEVQTHKVEFFDYDGKSWTSPQYVVNGGDAALPPNPHRDGYAFAGWDKPLNNITAPVKIHAVYKFGERDIYTVKFYGKITGELNWILLKEEKVPVGSDAHAPAPSVNGGYVFTGWRSSYTNIQSDTNIFANYARESSVSGAERLRVFKEHIEKLELPKQLEDALFKLGEYLAKKIDGGPSTRTAIPEVYEIITVIVAFLISIYGAISAQSIKGTVTDFISSCFGESDSQTEVERINTELEEKLNEGDSEAQLPENTTDAGKEGSKAWSDAKKKIKEGRGKGINVKTETQEDAEKLLNDARPELEKKPTYSKEGTSGYEIHPAEPDVGNTKPHIKWWDWSNGKANGAEGHIYFN